MFKRLGARLADARASEVRVRHLDQSSRSAQVTGCCVYAETSLAAIRTASNECATGSY